MIHTLVTYCSVDFTILFEYPYFFDGFSADKIRQRIWVAKFFPRISVDKNSAANSATGRSLGSNSRTIIISLLSSDNYHSDIVYWRRNMAE